MPKIIMAKKGNIQYIFGYRHKSIKYWFTYLKYKLQKYEVEELDYDEI